MFYNQVGGGKCSLCGSEGTNKSTCPLNPDAIKTNPTKHPLALKSKQLIEVKKEVNRDKISSPKIEHNELKEQKEQTGIENVIEVVSESIPQTPKVQTMLDFLDQADVSETSFTGTYLNDYSGMLYFLKNYKNACVPIVTFEGDFYEFSLQWTCTFDDVGRCLRVLEVPKGFEQGFRSCLANKNVRFIFGFIRLSYWNNDSNNYSAHANAYVVDLKDKDPRTGKPIITVELFEPHGFKDSNSDSMWYDQPLYVKQLTDLFTKLGAKHVYEARDFCPARSFQSLQDDEIDEALATDPGGFCAAWSLWWIEYRLKNAESNKTRAELVKDAIKTLQERKDGKTLTKFIRNYAESIVKERNRVLENVYNAIGSETDGKKLLQEFANMGKQYRIIKGKKTEIEQQISIYNELLLEKKRDKPENYELLVKYFEELLQDIQKELVEIIQKEKTLVVDNKLQTMFENMIIKELQKVLQDLHSNKK